MLKTLFPQFSIVVKVLCLGNVVLLNTSMAQSIECHIVSQERDFPGFASFQIEDIDTEKPSSTIPDASFDRADRTPEERSLIFHNGCDNYYNVTLKERELGDLLAGKVLEIFGDLVGCNSDMEEDETLMNLESGGSFNRQVKIRCQVLK